MKKTKTSRIIGNFYTEPKNKHTIELTKLIYKQY